MHNHLPFWPEWTVEDKIGQGSYGTVYKIRKRRAGSGGTDICSALKVLRIPTADSEILNLRNQGMAESSIRKLLENDVKAMENEIRVMISLLSSLAGRADAGKHAGSASEADGRAAFASCSRDRSRTFHDPGEGLCF